MQSQFEGWHRCMTPTQAIDLHLWQSPIQGVHHLPLAIALHLCQVSPTSRTAFVFIVGHTRNIRTH